MAKDISLSDLKTSLKEFKNFFIKHTSIIFVIVVLGALGYSVFAANLILSTPTDTVYQDEKESETTSTQFDKNTIKKVEALGDRQNPPEPNIPAGRINPFAD